MARLTRAELFAPDEVAVVHVISRVVRRCFLLGDGCGCFVKTSLSAPTGKTMKSASFGKAASGPCGFWMTNRCWRAPRMST